MDQRIIQHGEFELTVNLRTWESRQTGTRVYVSHELYADTGDGPRAGDEGLADEYRYANGTKIKDGDVLYTQRKAYPAVDRAWDRHNRAIVDAQRQVILEALDDAPGIDVADEQVFAFSKHAGCSCPCSPGFVVKHDRRKARLYLDGVPIDDLWINKAGAREAMLTRQAEARAARVGDVKLTKPVEVDVLLAVLDDVAADKLTADEAFAKLNES